MIAHPTASIVIRSCQLRAVEGSKWLGELRAQSRQKLARVPAGTTGSHAREYRHANQTRTTLGMRLSSGAYRTVLLPGHRRQESASRCTAERAHVSRHRRCRPCCRIRSRWHCRCRTTSPAWHRRPLRTLCALVGCFGGPDACSSGHSFNAWPYANPYQVGAGAAHGRRTPTSATACCGAGGTDLVCDSCRRSAPPTLAFGDWPRRRTRLGTRTRCSVLPSRSRLAVGSRSMYVYRALPHLLGVAVHQCWS